MGASCDAKLDECAGSCLSFEGAQAVCTSRCVLGAPIDSRDCGGLGKGLCVIRPDPNGSGDYGYCTAACTAHDQCAKPDWWCFGNDYPNVSNGFCFAATKCPNGDECSSDELCMVVGSHGPVCLRVNPSTCAGENGGAGQGGDGGHGGGPLVGPCELEFPLETQ